MHYRNYLRMSSFLLFRAHFTLNSSAYDFNNIALNKNMTSKLLRGMIDDFLQCLTKQLDFLTLFF